MSLKERVIAMENDKSLRDQPSFFDDFDLPKRRFIEGSIKHLREYFIHN